MYFPHSYLLSHTNFMGANRITATLALNGLLALEARGLSAVDWNFSVIRILHRNSMDANLVPVIVLLLPLLLVYTIALVQLI